MSMHRLPDDDIQGLLRHGYPFFDAAAYCLFRIEDPAATKRWLDRLQQPPDRWIDKASLGAAQLKKDDCGVAIAFTACGLGRLGLSDDALESFIPEFLEGMHAPHRARLLGDVGANAPSEWEWGNDDVPVDGLLAVYTRHCTERIADYLSDRVLEIERLPGCPPFVRRIDASLAVEKGSGISREPFGFADGISQPHIVGLTRKAAAPGVRSVRPGEFVLGYLNEIDRLPASPSVSLQDDPQPVLPRLPNLERTDLGRNGTFLVMRQLEQDTAAFEQFVDGNESLAAAMVGRWYTGEPLVRAPHPTPKTTQRQLEAGNGFGYHHEDRHGFRCPIGAHIRRANPRDALAEGLGITPQRAQELTDQHRILRRGRLYRDNRTGTHGLVFICLNANIERQFEFVQSSWLMSSEFGGLLDETDPLLGPAGRTFTAQRPLLGQRCVNLPQFVTVKGGAYFFLPGFRALRYLAQLP